MLYSRIGPGTSTSIRELIHASVKGKSQRVKRVKYRLKMTKGQYISNSRTSTDIGLTRGIDAERRLEADYRGSVESTFGAVSPSSHSGNRMAAEG